MAVLQKNGINDYTHACRQICTKDFTDFDYIFGFDQENIDNINEVAPRNATAKVMLLGSFDPLKELIIEDPYWTVSHNKNAFHEVYDQCLRCCTAFLNSH